MLWPELAMKLQQEFKWQRLIRLTKYNGCEHLEQPLDWTMSHKMQRTTSGRLACALRAFHQGTLHGFKGQCPLCGVELSTVHLIWECSYWQGRVKDIPDEWKDRISQNIEPEIWNRGLSQLERAMEDLLPLKELASGTVCNHVTSIMDTHMCGHSPSTIHLCHWDL